MTKEEKLIKLNEEIIYVLVYLQQESLTLAKKIAEARKEFDKKLEDLVNEE